MGAAHIVDKTEAVATGTSGQDSLLVATDREVPPAMDNLNRAINPSAEKTLDNPSAEIVCEGMREGEREEEQEEGREGVAAQTQSTTSVANGCTQIYLDIGSNVGVQVRKLFEPHLYPEASVLPIFDKVFGP